MDNATAVELLRARGYEQVCWTHHMVMPDLHTALATMPTSPAPAGVAFHAISPERPQDARTVRNDSFRDHFGSMPATEETWRSALVAWPSALPTASSPMSAASRWRS